MLVDLLDLKRNEVVRWIRYIFGVVGGRDLFVDFFEDDFRIVLRSGILLCNVFNKVKFGVVLKVCFLFIYFLLFCICFFLILLLYVFLFREYFFYFKDF